jgi:hypothetical protein
MENQRELAAAKGASLALNAEPRTSIVHCLRYSASGARRTLDNLILSAIQNAPAGGRPASIPFIKETSDFCA